jgi:hypothetical protein
MITTHLMQEMAELKNSLINKAGGPTAAEIALALASILKDMNIGDI